MYLSQNLFLKTKYNPIKIKVPKELYYHLINKIIILSSKNDTANKYTPYMSNNNIMPQVYTSLLWSILPFAKKSHVTFRNKYMYTHRLT